MEIFNIPMNTKHENKIIFGLTGRQLGYVSIGFVPLLMIKDADIAMWFKITVSALGILISLILTVGRIPRGKWQGYLLSEVFLRELRYRFVGGIYKYQGTVPIFVGPVRKIKGKDKLNEFPLAGWSGINDIDDEGLVYLDGGQVIKILKVLPVNFNRSDSEKLTLMVQYQEFLNKINSYSEIICMNNLLDLSDYLILLERRSEEVKKGSHLVLEYRDFLYQSLKKKKVLTKEFYIVFNIDLNKSKRSMRRQVETMTNIIRTGVEKFGSKAIELDRNQVIKAFQDCFGGSVSKEKKLKREKLAASLRLEAKKESQKKDGSIISRIFPSRKGINYTPADIDLLPDWIINDKEYVEMNLKLYRTLAFEDWPNEVEGGWMGDLYNFPANMRIAMHIYPLRKDQAVTKLTDNMRLIDADRRRTRRAESIPDPDTEDKFKDAEKMRKDAARGDVKLFNHHCLITLAADSYDSLEQLTEELQGEASAKMAQLKTLRCNEDRGFLSTLPSMTLLERCGRDFDTKSLSTCFPFSSSEIIHPDGVVFGFNRDSNSLVIIDRFGMDLGHMLIVAASRAGKSYETKNILTQENWRGSKGLLVDPSPDREYKRWCNSMGGNYISLGLGEDIVNPMEIVPPRNPLKPDEDERNPVTKKVEYMKNLTQVMAGGGLSSKQLALIDRILYEVYYDKGFTDNWEDNFVGGTIKESPILYDYYSFVEKEDKAVASLIHPWVMGSMRMFNGRTNVRFDNDITVFDISALVEPGTSEEVKQVTYLTISELILREIKRSREKRVANIDEAHYLFANPIMSTFTEQLLRISARFNVAVTLESQRLGDFKGESASVVLANTPLVLLMKQLNENEIDDCKNAFRLSDQETMFLRTAQQGEGLLLAGTQRVALSVKVPDGLHRIITTNPNDIKKYGEEWE